MQGCEPVESNMLLGTHRIVIKESRVERHKTPDGFHMSEVSPIGRFLWISLFS